jgi:hypothetical protein
MSFSQGTYNHLSIRFVLTSMACVPRKKISLDFVSEFIDLR